MLNKAERHKVVKLYRICSIVGLLPTQVDLESWQLKVASKVKRCLSFLSWSFIVLNVLYKVGTLAYTWFFQPNVQIHQLILHSVSAMAHTMTVLFYCKICVRDPALFAKYFNTTLQGNVGGPLDQEDEVKKHWTQRLKEYSLQDFIALWMPCVAATIPFVIATYIYDPTLKLLLYAALPDHLQTWATFGLCLLEETRLLLVFVVIVAPICQLQVISYDLVAKQYNLLKRAIRNKTKGTRSVYMSFRSLQLYIGMLNNINSPLIFAGKMLCIAVSIISGYAAVAHFREYPIFGIMYYVFLLDATLVYTLIFEKAFKIPQLFEETAACARLHVHGIRRGLFRRQILSVRRTGIQACWLLTNDLSPKPVDNVNMMLMHSVTTWT